MGLASPEMADRIDAEGRIQHGKGPTNTSQHKTANTGSPPIVEKSHDERKRETRKENEGVVAMLPHHDRILAEPRRVFLIGEALIGEEPSAVAVPESQPSIIWVSILVAGGMVPDMIGSPPEC